MMMLNKEDGCIYNMNKFHTFQKSVCCWDSVLEKFTKWSIIGYRGGYSWKTRTSTVFPFDTETERDAAWNKLMKA